MSPAKSAKMENKNDSPAVYIPPPLIYVVVSFAAILIQKILPLSKGFSHTPISKFLGCGIIVIGFFFNLPALRQSFIIGNWWNIVLLPVLFLIVQEYVIKPEEKYLDGRFEQQYHDYKAKVRRWL